MTLQFAPLCREHDRKNFDCGEPEMNRYIHQYLAQQVKRWNTSCTVLEDALTHEMIGFFTINPSSIPRSDLPFGVYSAYETASVYLLGRLAVSVKHQGKGYALNFPEKLHSSPRDLQEGHELIVTSTALLHGRKDLLAHNLLPLSLQHL